MHTSGMHSPSSLSQKLCAPTANPLIIALGLLSPCRSFARKKAKAIGKAAAGAPILSYRANEGLRTESKRPCRCGVIIVKGRCAYI